jgi:hypothetical protein
MSTQKGNSEQLSEHMNHEGISSDHSGSLNKSELSHDNQRNTFSRRPLTSKMFSPKMLVLRSRGIVSRNSKNSGRPIDNPQNPSSLSKKRLRVVSTKAQLRSHRMKIKDSTLQSEGELPAVKKKEQMRQK